MRLCEDRRSLTDAKQDDIERSLAILLYLLKSIEDISPQYRVRGITTEYISMRTQDHRYPPRDHYQCLACHYSAEHAADAIAPRPFSRATPPRCAIKVFFAPALSSASRWSPSASFPPLFLSLLFLPFSFLLLLFSSLLIPFLSISSPVVHYRWCQGPRLSCPAVLQY